MQAAPLEIDGRPIQPSDLTDPHPAIFIKCSFSPLLPIALFRVFYPPTFDITATSAAVDHEFLFEEYARRFQQLNTE